MRYLLMFFIPVMALTSCRKDTPEPDESAKVTVYFEHEVNGSPLETDVKKYENAAGNIFSVQRLRYFISGVSLVDDKGNWHKVCGVHLRDIKNDATRSCGPEDLQAGTYTGVRFIFGLDESKNVSRRYVHKTDRQNMEWPDHMGGGYHYMQMDGTYKEHPGAGKQFYNVHTGRIVVKDSKGMDSVVHENYFAVEIDMPGFTVKSGEKLRFDLVMNILEWYTNPEVYNFAEYNGIMNNQAAQEVLSKNGRKAFSVKNLNVQ
jgi:hypothetical protein